MSRKKLDIKLSSKKRYSRKTAKRLQKLQDAFKPASVKPNQAYTKLGLENAGNFFNPKGRKATIKAKAGNHKPMGNNNLKSNQVLNAHLLKKTK